MKRVSHVLLLGFLFIVVWPVYEQVPATASDYVFSGT